MPSFDIVNELNHQELKNAIDQTLRVMQNRYDFKGCIAEITKQENGSLLFVSEDDYKVGALFETFSQNAAKRGLDLKTFKQGKTEPAAAGKAKCEVAIVEGVPTEQAKEMVKLIKGTKLKVQAAIQGESLRISGKKKDELQAVMAAIKAANYPTPLQFVNFRD